MSTSVREYAVLYLGGKKMGGGAASGGNVLLNSGQHALDGPEHTGQLPLERISTDILDPTWHVVADGFGGLELVPDLGGSGGSGSGSGGGSGTGSALEVLDEGVSLDDAVTSINVTGGGATASHIGHDVTINVPGPTASGGAFFGPLLVNDPAIVTTDGLPVYVPLCTADGVPVFIEYTVP